jgi:hypothetical protein
MLAISLVATSNDAFASLRASRLSSSTTQASQAAANTAVTTYKEDNTRSGNHTTETTLTQKLA